MADILTRRMQSTWIAGLEFLAPNHEARVPLDFVSFTLFLVPAYACYYAMAVLALMPSTQLHRLVLWLPAVYASWKAGTSVDVSNGIPKYNHNNYGYCVVMWAMAMRITEWAFLSGPLERPTKYRGRGVWKDALDLCCNLRGINWPWARGLYIPAETRPTHSKLAFVRATFLRMLRDAFACDLVQVILQHTGPHSYGSLAGGTIFDPALAPVPRYLAATLITLLAGLGIYSSLNMMYHCATVLAFALADQDPADWPPLSAAPWAATSLADFWGRRWHQSFRRAFVVLGARPAAALGGRAGGVLGAFLLSAAMHSACVWGMARGGDAARIGGFFVVNGVGVVCEGAFRAATGRAVRGWWGWLWTGLFVLSSANLVIDAWLIRGFVGSAVFPEPLRPAAAVAKVATYLRTVL